MRNRRGCSQGDPLQCSLWSLGWWYPDCSALSLSHSSRSRFALVNQRWLVIQSLYESTFQECAYSEHQSASANLSFWRVNFFSHSLFSEFLSLFWAYCAQIPWFKPPIGYSFGFFGTILQWLEVSVELRLIVECSPVCPECVGYPPWLLHWLWTVCETLRRAFEATRRSREEQLRAGYRWMGGFGIQSQIVWTGRWPLLTRTILALPTQIL